MTSIRNISFIIIARNEEFAVEKCLESIASMDLENCEVICVDSDSTDSTLTVMQDFRDKIDHLVVLKCSGYVNAAVARNAGLKYATKDYIYFVDGDVELYPEFIASALNRIQSDKADAVTGKLHEIQYSEDYKKVIHSLTRRTFQEERVCQATGGIFIASKQSVKNAGLFDENFVRLQDFEYTLRISRCGTLLQLPEFIGIHHTQEYHDRSWEHYRKGHSRLYGVLMRKNWNNINAMKFLIRGNRGLATFLIISTALCASLMGGIVGVLSWSSIVLILAGCLLIDASYSLAYKRVKMRQWLLHNYLEPPEIIIGAFRTPRYVDGETQVECVYGCNERP